MRELKPCPFCGENPKVKQAGFGDGKQEYTIFHCKCGERYMHMSYWNTRPIEDALRAENRRLNRALILSRTVIDAVARETNKDFTAINAMIDEALKDGE